MQNEHVPSAPCIDNPNSYVFILHASSTRCNCTNDINKINDKYEGDHYVHNVNTLNHQEVFIPASKDSCIGCVFAAEKFGIGFSNPNTDFAFIWDNPKRDNKSKISRDSQNACVYRLRHIFVSTGRISIPKDVERWIQARYVRVCCHG